MQKNRVLLGIFVICIISMFLLNNTTTKAKAEYSDGIKIDNVQEAAYEKIFDLDNYQIWYANNNTYHFLFIITPYNFTDFPTEIIKIRNHEINYTFSWSEPLFDPFIKTQFINNTLEVFVRRELLGNTFALEIKGYTFALNVIPQQGSQPHQIAYVSDDDDDDDEKVDSVDNYVSIYGLFLVFGKWWQKNIILYWLSPFIIFYVLCVIARTFFRPYCFYKNKKGKIEYLGRFSHEVPSEKLLGFFDIYFKGFKQLKMVFSKIPFASQRRFAYMNFGLFLYFSDIIYHKIKIPGDIVLYEQERVKTAKNSFKYGIYRFFAAVIPGVVIANKLHESVEYKIKVEKEDTTEKKKFDKKAGKTIYYQRDKLDVNGKPIPVKIEEIPVLTHQLMFDKISIVCDVCYNLKQTSEKGETIVRKKEEKKPLYYVLDLKKNEKVSKVIAYNYQVEIIPEYDIEEAIMKQNYIDNVKSIFDLKTARFNQSYIELDKKYNMTRDQYNDLSRHINSVINDKIIEIYQKTVVDQNTIVEIVSLTLTAYKETKDVKEAARLAFRQYYDRKEMKENGDYKTQYEIEKIKNNLLENQMKETKTKNPFIFDEKEEIGTDLSMD